MKCTKRFAVGVAALAVAAAVAVAVPVHTAQLPAGHRTTASVLTPDAHTWD